MNNAAATPKKERRWASIPAARSSAPVLKIRLAVVLGFLITSSLLGLFGGIAWLTNRPELPEPPPPTAQATGFAAEVANAWLGGRTLTLPVGVGVDPTFGAQRAERASLGVSGAVSWTGFRLLNPVPGRTIEVHNFVLGGNPPRMLVVPVELTDSGPVLAAAPTLEPLPLAAAPGSRFDYLDQEDREPLNSDVERLAGEWVKAYASDDRTRLRELTGDPQPRTYPGLGGFTVRDSSVLSAIPSSSSEGMWVVRVTATLVNSDGFVGTNEWDLLVDEPQTANPNVVAWGAAGLGLYLEPYENGLRAAAGTATTTTVPAVDGEREAPPADPSATGQGGG